MRAVQDGKLSLDEDINAYLPFEVVNPHAPGDRITLRQLATHTSGIADRRAVYDAAYHYGGDSPESLDDFLRGYLLPAGKDFAKENFLDARPGTRREYSNIGAALAGRIVEIAVGERLDTYTKRHFFQPLGMANTGIFWATKYDGTRIGHNGSDPGVRTMMLSDPAREIGVVLFCNTSLSESGMGTLGAVFDALWAQAAALKHPPAGAAVE